MYSVGKTFAVAEEAVLCHWSPRMGCELLKQEPESCFSSSVCCVGLGCERQSWRGLMCAAVQCLTNFNLTLYSKFPFVDKLISAWEPGRQVPR